jgi:hypothetical protein
VLLADWRHCRDVGMLYGLEIRDRGSWVVACGYGFCVDGCAVAMEGKVRVPRWVRRRGFSLVNGCRVRRLGGMKELLLSGLGFGSNQQRSNIDWHNISLLCM